jgi:UDP-glucose 4-epimerase
MNICLTGGAGYIGSHTATVLDNAGYSVTIFDNFSNSNKSVVVALKRLTNNPINCIGGDILDPVNTKYFERFQN